MKNNKIAFFILLSILLSINTKAQTLRTLATTCNLNIGAAISDDALRNDPMYGNILKQEYNIVVNENAMKMFSIKPSETGPYNFDGPDRLLAFAQANGMKMRGHTILWHEGLPDWVKNKAWTKASLLQYLKGYITTVAGRYKGKITEWDVANEFVQNGNGNALRTDESVWMRVIGEEVLDSAFKWMHQVDPTAKLYYNDYGAENMGGKSNAVYELAKRLKQRGAPINGVGLQCHFSYDIATTSGNAFLVQYDQNIKRLGALGLQVSMTEVDLGIPVPFDAAKYQLQATSYANIMKVVLSNSSIVKTFLPWGFTDKYSWIPNFSNYTKGAALLFYNDYTKKPAYTAIENVFSANCKPVTCSATINANGGTTFCQGGNVVLTASAGASYKWFNGAVQVGTSVGYTATTSGSYTVEVINSSGCKATSAARVVSVTAPLTWYADADGDGKGNSLVTLLACTKPVGYVSDKTDLCPSDGNKIAPGLCGCGIVEGACSPINKAPVVSFEKPIPSTLFTAPAKFIVVVNAADADGTIASVDLYINSVFIRQEKVSPYEWNINVVDATLNNLPAGMYTLKAIAKDNLGKSTEVSIVITVKAVDLDPITGPSCASKSSIVTYELGALQRANATSYAWWFSGSQAIITPTVGSAYKASVALTNSYSGGSICIGVNYGGAPYYLSYCKALGVCGARLSSNELNVESSLEIATVYPNPAFSDIVYIDSEKLVHNVEIFDAMGTLVIEMNGSEIQKGISIARLSAGTYTLRIVVEDNVRIRKLVINR